MTVQSFEAGTAPNDPHASVNDAIWELGPNYHGRVGTDRATEPLFVIMIVNEKNGN